MLVRLVRLLLLGAACASPSGPFLTPLPWSLRKIISAVESRTEFQVEMRYQLFNNLPTVNERMAEATPDQFLPVPEVCENCIAGSKPQPDEAGLVSSLVNTASERFSGSSGGSAGSAGSAGGSASRAFPGQFPWHVSLLYNTYFYSCSGSLISDEWVLTAANCVAGFSWYLVRLGMYRPGADKERFQTTLNSSHIVVHPSHRRGRPLDDIALLRLPAPVKITSYTLPVRLPSLNSFTTTYEGRKAWLSGLGVTSKLGTLEPAATLGFVVERVLSNRECARTFGNVTAPSILCTTTDGFTSGTRGDSGAPLVVEEGSRFIQVGILAFESAEGFATGSPAGYTRITSYLRWIQNTTGISPAPDVRY